MSRKERNRILMNMLEPQSNMIVFPSTKVAALDGLPHLSFVEANLKEIINKEEKSPKKAKIVLNPRVDMGIPQQKPGQEHQARAGATFDPKQFKGNVMLFQHLNEVALSMLRKPVEPSASVKKKKHIKTSFNDDYGLKLLEEDIKRNKVVQDSDSSSDEELDHKI